MATKDFRASQLETSKIIGTGSIAGTTAGIAIYSGSIATNREGGTSDSAMFSNVGSDVFLFVSGNISNTNNTRTNSALFGGDVVISGTLYAERQVIEVDSVADGDFFVTGNMYVEPDNNSAESVVFRKADGTSVLKVNTNTPSVDINGNLILTGNIHMLSDNFDGVNIETENSFEIKAQNNIIMKLDSDDDTSNSFFGVRDGSGDYNFIVYENQSTYVNFARLSTIDFRVRGDNDYGLVFTDASADAVALGRKFDTDFGSEPDVGTDVKVLLSGTIGSRGSGTRGATLNTGDFVVSGTSDLKSNLFITGSIETTGDISLLANNSLRFNNPGQNDQFINGNNATITLDADDGITLKSDSYIYHNINDTIDNVFSTAQTVFNFNRDDIDFRVNTDDYYGTIFVDANDNTVILGNQGFDSTPVASEVPGYGADVKLYLSGTTGTKDSAIRGVTLVAGDLVTSGATHLQSDLFITGNIRMQSSNNDGISINAENNFQIGAEGSIIFTIDSDNDSATGRYFGVKDGSGTFSIVAYEQGDVVINNSLLATNDFFVKGDTNHSAIFVDASEDAVAIGRLLSTDFGSEPGVGTDVKVLLSGTVGSIGTSTRGASLVAGDLVVSGSSRLAAANFTGDVTLEEGASLIIPTGIVHKSDVNTSVTFNNDRIRLFTNNTAKSDFTSTQVLILSGGSANSYNEAAAPDVNFYVSGSVGSKGTSARGTSVFGGDMVVSGTIYDAAGNSVGGITINNDTNDRIITATGTTNTVNGEANLLFNGTQLTVNAFVSASSGLNVQNGKGPAVGIRVPSSTTEPVVSLNSVFESDLRFSTGGNTYGSDVGVLISGSVNSKGIADSKGVTLLAGDLVLSGNVYDKSGNDYIKDVEKGSVIASLGSTAKQYFPADDQQTEGTSIQYYSFVAPVFSGSFNTIGLRAYGTTGFSQLSDLGGITASFHRGFPGTDPQAIDTSPDFIEDVFINLASHAQNTTLQINFSGSNFNPGDTYAWAIKPDNNWNNGGSKYLAYTVITSHKTNQ